MNAMDITQLADEINTATAGVLTCNGSYDTRIKTGGDYRTITWAEICALAENPAIAEKKLAPAIVPSTYHAHDGREHAAQRQRGRFILLCVDIDKGNPTKAEVVDAMHEVTGHQPLDLIVYSTSSATRENRKWRALVRLAERIPGLEYAETQEALFDLLEAQGLTCDRALARTGQLVYLPNVAPDRRDDDGQPLSYDFTTEHQDLSGNGPGLDLADTPIPEQIERRRGEREAAQAKALAEAAERRAQRTGRAEGGLRTIEAYNARHDIKELLIEHGYSTDGRGNWRSRYQESDSYATKVYADGYWVSLSGSDAAKGLGFPTQSGHRAGDAFDLFCHYEHENNFAAALAAASVELANDEFEVIQPDEEYLEQQRLARRERQMEENRQIGEETPPVVMPEILTPSQMLTRFAFAYHGSAVVDLENPMVSYALPDFRNMTAASRLKIEEKEVPVAGVWLKHPKRITVASRTFRPGHSQFTTDPDGRACVNTWQPFERFEPSLRSAENVALFEDHIDFLFGADAGRFLDWLAHIEQKPGQLPHVAWLHIAEATGVGRNWVASVLTRIWRGRVAASFNLTSTLATGFNAHLSNKLLAVVDEVREGGRDDAWAHSEALKTLVTQETRLINEKYGRQWTEYNCCRLLLFSNHWNALPLDDTDRRFEVAAWGGKKRTPAYYSRLYGALADGGFTSDIATWLAQRDISSFNPGAHASASAAKKILVAGQISEPKSYGLAIRDGWPSDLISCTALAEVIDPRSNGSLSALVRNVAIECGMRPFTRRVRVAGKPTRLYAIRNAERWAKAAGKEIAAEVMRGFPGALDGSWRDYVDGFMAE